MTGQRVHPISGGLSAQPLSRWDSPVTRAVGIDLGTSNSVVAVLEDGRPRVIMNSEGRRSTPSVVAFARSGELLVGQPAVDQAVRNLDRTFRAVERRISSDWTTPNIDGTCYRTQEISARVLQKLKRDAEAYLGEEVTDAVLAVPTFFGSAQRLATKEAGQIAGLNVLRIVTEPTAAALTFALNRNPEWQKILVFDLGASSLGLSLVDTIDGYVDVKATNGDDQLGGDDWSERIVSRLADSFRSAEGLELTRDRTAMQRLRDAADQAKIKLSSQNSTTITLPYIGAGRDGNLRSLEETLTRADFQRITSDLVDRIRGPVSQVVEDAGVTIGQIDHVVLVGGSTRMPAVTDLVKELTGGKEPSRGINPDEAVAVGAALQAGVLKGEVKDVLLLDATSYSLGVETTGGVMTRIIERNSSIPTKRSEIFTNSPGRASDELGLSVPQVPRSRPVLLGSERPAVPEPSPEPASYDTSDTSRCMPISVFEGEREIASYNTKLGVVVLNGLPDAPRGALQIEVTVDVDADGIINVSAKNLGTGRHEVAAVSGTSALSRDELDRMTRLARRHEEEHRTRREHAELRNQAETLAYQTEKFLDEVDRIPAELRDAVQTTVDALRSTLEGADIGTVRSAVELLAVESQQLGAVLYQQPEPSSGTPAEAAAAAIDEFTREHVDEDFEETIDQDRSPAPPSASTTGGTPRRGVFISYRRDETGWVAWALREALTRLLGEDSVFHDISSIRLGTSFRDAIFDAIGDAAVVFVLIGKNWASMTDSAGNRRLDDENDLVRVEIEEGLRHQVHVVPVLVGDTPMPDWKSFPTAIARLGGTQAGRVALHSFEADAVALADFVSSARRDP
jgi:molecular chaperone DnaK